MSVLVEKSVQITDDRVRKLAELAEARGTSENSLIEEGLDLLFRESDLSEIRRRDSEMLRQLESEIGPLKPSSRKPIRVEDAVLVVGTPIDPKRVRRLGDCP